MTQAKAGVQVAATNLTDGGTAVCHAAARLCKADSYFGEEKKGEEGDKF